VQPKDAGSRKRVSANPALIRQLNVARVFHALRLHPGASQRELSGITSLDRATVSAVVAQLEGEGLVVRGSRRTAGRVGRPEVALSVAEDAGVLLGARLEPGSIRLIATSLVGRKRATLQLPSSTDPERAANLLVEGAARLLAEAGVDESAVRGIGVGVPALMQLDGTLRLAPNFGWREVQVKGFLDGRFAAPVQVDNDTNAAALAEKLFGSCQRVSDFVFVAGHSGVGGALYLGGRLYRGLHGFAGEIGHIKVVPGGRPCGCGAKGCLEAYLSEPNLLAQAVEAGVRVDDLGALRARADAGEPAAAAVLTRAGEYLGDVLAGVVNLLDPERIVLGGNLTTVGEPLLAAARGRLQENALEATASGCELTVSPLGLDAVTMGGVALALEGFLSLPSWLAATEIQDSFG
jgi:predicted NBD/HSP70 family sugar kinase